MKHLRSVIFISFEFDKLVDRIKNSKETDKSEKIKETNKVYNQLVTDIISVSDKKIYSNKEYHERIKMFRDTLIPLKKSYRENSIPYDVKANPFDYLPFMIEMNKILEQLNKTIIDNHKDKNKNPPIYGLFNALP